MLRCCIWIILVHFQQVLWRSVLLEKVWNSLYIRKVCRANKGSGTDTSSCANLFMTENIIETWIQVLHTKNWNMILAEMTPRTSRLPVNWVRTSVTHKEKSKGVFTEGYPENIISYYSSAFAINRELKNHDEVHDDDVCWLGKDWNENVSFGGKKET